MKRLTVTLLLPLALSLAGCGAASGGREIPISMTDFKLNPAKVTVAPGERVTFVLTNESGTEHEYESDAGHFEEVLVPAHKSRKVAWTAPEATGDYEFECDMAGHDGMSMVITVQKP